MGKAKKRQEARKLAKSYSLTSETEEGILHVGTLTELQYSLDPHQTPMLFRGGISFLYPYYDEDDYVPDLLAMIDSDDNASTGYGAFCLAQESLELEGEGHVIIKKQVKYNRHTLTVCKGE